MGAVSTSKRSNAGKNVLVFFIVFIILEVLIIFGIGKVFKNDDVTPSIMGYSFYMTKEDLVQTDPDGSEVVVPKNVLVLASNGLTDPTNKIGCAVLCENINGSGKGSGVYWLADITPREFEDGVDYTVTNGTQSHVISSSNIVGVCASYFVTAGKVIGFVTQKFGMICCLVVPVFLLVLIELIIAIATHSSDDYEDDEDDEEDGEEDKNVQLDDFLFGGQSEGEQIAKRRKKAKAAAKDSDEEDDEPASVGKSAEKAEKPARKAADDDFDIRLPAAEEKTAAAEDIEHSAAGDSLSFKGDEVKSEYYEKASRIVDGAADLKEETPAAAGRRPARSQGARASSRRRRPVNADTSDASLEDLMKMMEEEQNKLRDKIN